MLDVNSLANDIFAIKSMLSKINGDVDDETISNIAMGLATIKGYCRSQGAGCGECPFNIDDNRIGCCFAPIINNRAGVPENWLFK